MQEIKLFFMVTFAALCLFCPAATFMGPTQESEAVQPHGEASTHTAVPSPGDTPLTSLEHTSILEQHGTTSVPALDNKTGQAPASEETSRPPKKEWNPIEVVVTLLGVLALIAAALVIVLLLRRYPLGTWLGRTGRNRPAEPDADQSSEMPQERIDHLGSPSRAAVQAQQIDQIVGVLLDKGNQLRLKIMKGDKKTSRVERRLFLRIPVPPGAMEICWANENGEEHHGAAIDISLRGVLFEARDFDSTSIIEKIVCYSLGFTLPVRRSRIQHRDRDRAVAVIEGFQSKVEDQMKWIEIFTRIEECR